MKKILLASFLILALSATSFATISIMTLRNMYTGTPVVLGIGTVIKGTVISDNTTNNITLKNLYLEDNSGGISIRFTASHSFPLGDSLTIDISGDTLQEFNGLLQVSNADITNASVLGVGTIVPPVVTVNDIITNMNGTTDTWESILVTINNATITSTGGTYSGSATLTDASGSVTLYTRSVATFATTTVPTGPVNVTAIITDYNLTELNIRNLNDVVLLNGINQTIAETNSYSVYPNPAHGFIQVNAMNNANTESNFKITDASGRVLKSGLLQYGAAKQGTVDVNELPLGIYILSVEGKNSTQQIKVVIR